MDKNFIPKKIVEDNVEYVLLNDVFRSEEVIYYSLMHNFPIKFICTTYTCACEILAEIQENGYELSFNKVPVCMNGRTIDYSIEVFCNKVD